MNKTGYTFNSRNFTLIKILNHLSLFIVFTILTQSCDLDFNSDDEPNKQSLLILSVDKDQNFTFHEIKNFQDFSNAFIYGMETYSDNSFALFESNNMTKGFQIKYMKDLNEYDTPKPFSTQSNFLDDYSYIDYNWAYKNRSEIHNLIFDMFPSTNFNSLAELINLHYENGNIKLKRTHNYPNQIINDSLYIRYELSTRTNLDNLFNIRKTTYVITMASNDFNPSLKYKSSTMIYGYFPDNSDLAPIVYEPSVGDWVERLDELMIIPVINRTVFYGKSVNDESNFVELGSTLDFLGVDDSAVYFCDYLYDIKSGQKIEYTKSLIDYKFNHSSFTIDKQLNVVKYLNGKIQLVSVNKNTLIPNESHYYDLTEYGGITLYNRIRSAKLADGSQHFLIATITTY